MKLKRRNRLAAEVSTSSLNDIMFFLLLFFLIISTVANPSVIKLLLPRAASSQTLQKKVFTVSVTADKRYYLNNDEVAYPDLEARLAAEANSYPEPTVVLRFDQSLTIQDIVDILQIGAKHKIKMVLSTQK